MEEHAQAPWRATGPWRVSPRSGSPDALLETIADRARMPLCTTADMTLLHRGDSNFDRLIASFEAARRSISVEIYQIRPDTIGRRLAEALARAAERGVEVRLIVDSFGTSGARDLVAPLPHRGVNLRWFNPFSLYSSLRQRTHRKLAIIDGQEATIGGMNWADEFSEHKTGNNCWRDVALWVKGEVVDALLAQFNAAWSGDAEAPEFVPTRGSRFARACAVGGGVDGRSGHRRAYRAMADAAQHELLLATPYFLPDADLRLLLSSTASRGVRVVVIVPRRCDIGPFKHAGRVSYFNLLASGVEVWERFDRMVHAKVAIIDRAVAAVGSVNLTRQSLDYNSETMILTSDSKIVDEIGSFLLEESLSQAEALSGPSWPRHPDRFRLAELVAAPVGLVF